MSVSNLEPSVFAPPGPTRLDRRSGIAWLFRTDDSLAPVFARLALGIAMFPHGAQKVLGWFGGNGFSATVGFMHAKLGIPTPLVVLEIIAEFFGAIGLVTGCLTRVAAFGILCVMVVAVAMVHLHMGFFMNWQGNQAGEGFEYHLLAVGLALALLVWGGGAASIDRFIARALDARSR